MRWLLAPLLLLASCVHDHSHDKVEAKPYIVELRDNVDIEAFIDEHYAPTSASNV